MAATMTKMAMVVAFLGLVSFIFGVVAENKKPAAGTVVMRNDVVVCKYHSDPTVVLGYLSFTFLLASTVAGLFSLFYPYKGKAVPRGALFESGSFIVFFVIALFTAGLAGVLLLWPTLTEQLHMVNNVHHNLKTECPTAKTGLLGGGAFVSLDASLLWLVALMLAGNAREDYFEEVEKDPKGEYGHINSSVVA